MLTIARRYLDQHNGDRTAATQAFTSDLMRGDGAVHKAGYSRANAILAVAEAFDLDDAERAALETHVPLNDPDPHRRTSTMAFLITTKPGGHDASATHRRKPCLTLYDARVEVIIIARDHGLSDIEAEEAVFDALIDQQGGTVGPLPDQTTVEVKPIEILELAALIGLEHADAMTNVQVIDAAHRTWEA